MSSGTIKFFKEDKGFGFIIPDNGGEDIFFYHKNLIDEVGKNDKVVFETKDGKKGLEAINVKLA